MFRKLLVLFALAGLLISSNVARGGVFSRHHSSGCNTIIYQPAPPPSPRMPPSPPRPRDRDYDHDHVGPICHHPDCQLCPPDHGHADCCRPPIVTKVGWELADDLKLVPIYDFNIDPGSGRIDNLPCDGFAVKLCGPRAALATFAGETLRFAAVCQILLPKEYYHCLVRTGCPHVFLKPIVVPLQATLDEDGVARFARQDLYDKVGAELQRLRFFDHPDLIGLEEISIKITGFGRTGSFLFRSCNALILQGSISGMEATPSEKQPEAVPARPAAARRPST